MSQQINLYNPIFLRQKKIFSVRTMAQALGVIAVGLVGMSVFAAWQVKRLEGEVARIEARLKAEEARLTDARGQLTTRKPTATLEQAVREAQRELEMREAVIALVERGTLGESTGASVYLRALAQQHLSGLWLTGFEVAGRDMMLTGRALRAELVPEYLHRLGQVEALKGREFAMLRMERPRAKEGEAAPPWVEFQLRSKPPKEAP